MRRNDEERLDKKNWMPSAITRKMPKNVFQVSKVTPNKKKNIFMNNKIFCRIYDCHLILELVKCIIDAQNDVFF
jgi:hypothetical protein